MEVDISDQQVSKLDELTRERISDPKLDRYIDNLDLSADAKALIHDVKKATIRVGQKIIKVGKRAIEMVLAIMRQFPNVTMGLILGLLIGALISAIPLLGVLLGPFMTPILAAFGLALGFAEDLKDTALDRKIKEAVAMYKPLQGAA